MAHDKTAANLELLKLISEESFLEKLKSTFKKKMAAKPEEDTEPGRAKADTTTSQDSQLEIVASEAAYSKTGETRYVIYLSKSDLDGHYLKQGGGAGLVDVMDDEEVKTFVENPTFVGSRIREIGNDSSFRNLIAVPVSKYTTKANTAVIIDVPDALASQLKGAASEISAARGVLKKMMNHKYYVMTLNIAATQKIASKVDAARDNLDALKKAFNPEVMVNYPIKQVRVAAQNEWDELHSSSDEDGVGEPKSEPKPEEKPTEPKPAEPKPEEKPSAEKKDLTHEELLSQMKDLWATWRSRGEEVPPELRDFITKMADEVKAPPKAESLLTLVNSKPL
jgi:hypothetical protein